MPDSEKQQSPLFFSCLLSSFSRFLFFSSFLPISFYLSLLLSLHTQITLTLSHPVSVNISPHQYRSLFFLLPIYLWSFRLSNFIGSMARGYNNPNASDSFLIIRETPWSLLPINRSHSLKWFLVACNFCPKDKTLEAWMPL